MIKDYLLFGWRVRSDLTLPCAELPRSSGNADCRVTVLPPLESPQPTAPNFASILETNDVETVWLIDQDHWRVEYFERTTQQFLQINFSQRGRQIQIAHTTQVTSENIPPLLLTGLFTAILWKAGRVCLHGGVVQTKQGGLLLLGDSGFGKSTTLTALWQQGCSVLTDDIAVFEPSNPTVVYMGPRSLRLWPDSAQALGIDPHSLRFVFQPAQLGDHKRSISLEQRDCPTSTPIERIYILVGREQIEQPRFKRLAPHVAVAALLKYRFRGLQLEQHIHPQLLEVCVALAHHCHVYLVHTPANLEKLPEIAQAMLSHR